MKDQLKGVSSLLVKDLNMKLILQQIRKQRVSTIRELMANTGLTPATIKGILVDLLSQNRVKEGMLVPSGGGRPSRQYLYNENAALGLIIFAREINGEDSICIRIVNLYGQVIESIDPITDISWFCLEEQIAKCIEKYPAISAVSMGIPGIELGGKIVLMDYQSLSGTELTEKIKEKFNLPILIENDVNAAVMGSQHTAGNHQTEVYIYFPKKYPPGAGIKINGNLLKGHSHFAGEISGLPIGIEWGEDLSNSFIDFTLAVSKVLISLTAVLNPDLVVLYGEFVTDAHIASIYKQTDEALPQGVMPTLVLADDFNTDYELGLIAQLLAFLEV